MSEKKLYAENLADLGEFDYIIDVRSPSEFSYSHIPNALNLSVFSDDEYKEVGTLYKQDTLAAKLLGASLACKNIAEIVKNYKEIFHPKHKILIYCARGGNRSLSLFAVLDSIKLQVWRLNGGYKSYRNAVLDYLNAPLKHNFLTLCGDTGCGKSELIAMASDWSVDLEGLSRHYGSSFGFMAGKQPSEKMFQNSLAYELLNKKSKILLIENESKKLGSVVIPKRLYEAYQNAPKILITAPLNQRVERIVKMYEGIKEADFHATMEKISPYIAKNTKSEILESFKRRDLSKVAELLLVGYYDKVYKKAKFDFIVRNENLNKAYAEILDIRESLAKRR